MVVVLRPGSTPGCRHHFLSEEYTRTSTLRLTGIARSLKLFVILPRDAFLTGSSITGFSSCLKYSSIILHPWTIFSCHPAVVIADRGVSLRSSGPGGPGGLLPRGSHGSVRALSGIRLVTS